MKRNILFVMCDQLRYDYLSCCGHSTLQTPNIDRLAQQGVNFTRTYVPSPLCGPSRMSFYTGRSVFSHGARYNNYPLRVDEWTLGDYLRPLGVRTVLAGKTHMAADRETIQRLGIDPDSRAGVLMRQCGFEPHERDDGLHPAALADPDLAYNRYLREQGYESDNSWNEFANSAEGPNGEVLSGWYMRNAKFAARVQEEHSETAYMTNRAMDFIRDSGNEPWCLHLSYIKPHWPYMAPAPYHDLYGPEDVQAPNRSERERRDPHPVRSAFMQHEDSKNFARDAVRETVIPAYMGLVKQIDDHLGRLWKFLEAQGQWENTMIVFTSDHGDYLGDHWLGEKDLFHDESVRIPLLIHDPSPQADATRGTRDSRMVEGIDLLPTFIEWLGGTPPEHRLEGASLLPLLHGTPDVTWRDYAISESDYSNRRARGFLGLAPQDARATMVCTERWKGIFHPCFRPELYDLQNDPQERMDLGGDPEHEAVRRELKDRWFEWILQRKTRVTISEETIKNLDDPAQRGILIGYW